MEEIYLRQYPVIGLQGQRQLHESRVLVVGAGGIGSLVLPYLAAAGVGTLGVVDDDTVSRSNLHRQVLYGAGDIGASKVACVVKRFAEQFPTLTLIPHPFRLTADNATRVLQDYDIIVDGSDNFATRYLVNDVCCQLRLPFVSSSVLQQEWQVAFFTGHTPCYRCLYPVAPPALYSPNCSQAGVLGPLVAMAGSMAANAVLDAITGLHPLPEGTLYRYRNDTHQLDALTFFSEPNCPACVQQQVVPMPLSENEAVSMVTVDNVKDEYVWLDVREPWEQDVAPIDNVQTLPLSQLLQHYTTALQPKTPYALLCKTDVRSQKAYHFLKAKGFSQLVVIQGGASAWYQHHGKTLGY